MPANATLIPMGESPEKLEALHRYWSSLASGRPPERALIDPAAMIPLLPWLYIVEFTSDPFRVFYRLTGTSIDSWNGFNITGRYLDEFKDTDMTGSLAYLEQAYLRCRQTGQVFMGSYSWPSIQGNPMNVSVGIFPLSVDGAIRQAIVVEDYDSFPENPEISPWLDPKNAGATRD